MDSRLRGNDEWFGRGCEIASVSPEATLGSVAETSATADKLHDGLSCEWWCGDGF